MAGEENVPSIPPNVDIHTHDAIYDELQPGCGPAIAKIAAMIVLVFATLAVVGYLLMTSLFSGGSDDAASPASADATQPQGTNLPASTAADSPTGTSPTVTELPAAAPPRDPLVVDATLVPREGTWVITNQSATMACAGISVPLPEEQQSGTITLVDNGAAILASGFDPATADLLLTRTEAAPGRAVYVGEIGAESLGASAAEAAGVSLAFTMVFTSPDEVTASTTGSFGAGGSTCTIERPATGTPTGAPAGAPPPAPVGGVGAVDDEPYVVCTEPTATPEQVEIDDPVVAPTPAAALVAFLDGPEPQPDIDNDLVLLLGPEDTLYYAMRNESRAVTVLIEVEATGEGFAVTRWSSSQDC